MNNSIAPEQRGHSATGIIELRQYMLKPGQRDILIELFEREFVESQEALGMELPGMFRDADDSDRFVWLRGFADMESRARSLAAFYGGSVWKAHREAANATMVDSDNVLLLRPAWDGAGFEADCARAPHGTAKLPREFAVAQICYFDTTSAEAFVAQFRSAVLSLINSAGADFLAAFVTEPSVNTFPALPVREGENVLVWFSLFADEALARVISLPPEMAGSLAKPMQILRLRPTARSRRFRRD